ncbi:MAG: OsmC family protein [Crocinitomicaceae bacterium]|jgi:putative redox protein|nr:OsmC family protein [Crocinitomicaceae bacterium]MDA9986442.1 OsmC family protein [Crocinitomicaceae bacterium]MDG1350781.1 OsmC family protein [Crocinitomicaceae bacterium]MDG1734865.1 OsmC family protein [Crocinitomicaceae bacterium]MDG2505351.1 OsmC family protein [Crocinitomicaceae bacterium]
MLISEVSYLGNLRTAATHLKSKDTIITDAPTDNNGKGQAFSPTDLVATSLASCVMTIIGIHCNAKNIQFDSCDAKVEKIMGANPRRIKAINLEFDISKNNWDQETRNSVIKAAKSCPVGITLEGQVKVDYKFN